MVTILEHGIWSRSICVPWPCWLILGSRIHYSLVPLTWELSFYTDNINFLFFLAQRYVGQYKKPKTFYLIDCWLMTWHGFVSSLKILISDPHRYLSASAVNVHESPNLQTWIWRHIPEIFALWNQRSAQAAQILGQPADLVSIQRKQPTKFKRCLWVDIHIYQVLSELIILHILLWFIYSLCRNCQIRRYQIL